MTMPRGPKGEKHPADVNARAVMVARIATGEVDDTLEDDGKDPARQEPAGAAVWTGFAAGARKTASRLGLAVQ